jgi:probable phosphoglycerate mutase
MPGVGLSERGREEAEAAAERLAESRISALYASPMQRTRETAEIVASRLGLDIVERPALIELDFGEWTGATFESVRADPRWSSWNAQRSLASLPGGESMRTVQNRAVETMLELHQRHAEESVAIVSHGDVIRAILLFALGMPLDFFARIEIATASLSTIRLDPHGIRVVSINERPRPAG